MDSPVTCGWTGDRTAKLINYIVRGAAIVLTLIGVIGIGAAAETQRLSDGEDHKLKAAGTSQFEYLIAVNAIVCFYSLVSIILLVFAKGAARTQQFTLVVTNIIAMIILFLGSSQASSTMIDFGSDGLGICKVYTMFCSQVTAIISMTAFGGATFFSISSSLFFVCISQSCDEPNAMPKIE